MRVGCSSVATGGGGNPGSGSGTLTDVRAALADLRRDANRCGADSVSGLLTEITALLAEVEALRLTLVSRMEACGVWREDPNGTANSWLRTNHGLDHRGAESDLRAAELVRAYPALAAALTAGKISRAHVDVIASVGEANDARRGQLSTFMDVFVNIARSSPPSALRRVMRAWADQIDPLATSRNEFFAHQRRYLHVNHLADGVSIEGFFGHEQGAKVIAALNAALTKAWRTSQQRDSGDQGPRTDPEAAPPSTAQQRADAFVAGIIDPVLCRGDLPSAGGSRPSVTVVVPLSRLEQECGSSADPTLLLTQAEQNSAVDSASHATSHWPFIDGTARIGVSNGPGQVLISAQAALRITCDCEVHRVVINPAGLPLDVGRSMRTFPPHLRKALSLRDKGCVFPGCGSPPGWAQGHHIVHWAQGGRTSLDNAALLCSKHHHQVHSEGHVVDIGPDGRARVTLSHVRSRQ